ncbi:MAG TPA: CoA transferase [Rubrivivax sp.]|nr:CoA transferase [Rubrivivax sp.]
MTSPHPVHPGALSGLRVIDLSHVLAGPMATQMFGDHGAEVVKVEPPGGEVSRKMGPSTNEHGFSSHYFSVNRNKRAIALDLSRPQGVEVLMRLLADADVLIENFKPGTLRGFGLDYETVLAPRFPRLIVAHISGFGEDGPLGGLIGMDPTAQAMCGLMSWQGEPEGPPMRAAASIVDMLAGLYTASAILMALHERHASGRGQEIEVALFDAAFTLTHPFTADWFMSGREPARIGNRHPSGAPYNVYRCRDGHVLLACANDKQFRVLCEVLGRPELADDPRFSNVRERFRHHDAIDVEVSALCATRDKNEIAMTLLRAGVPAGAVLSIGEALRHEQVAARRLVVEDASIGFKTIGSPIRMSRTPPALHQRPARFGEHSRAVLREAGFTEGEIDALIAGRVLFGEAQAAG